MRGQVLFCLALRQDSLIACREMSGVQVMCVMSGFRREVDEKCALLGHYAASNGNFLPRFRDNLSGTIIRGKESNLDSGPLKMRPIGCPETSARNYHYLLRNGPEERISLLKVVYRDADRSLARPGRKQATATEDFEFHISCL